MVILPKDAHIAGGKASSPVESKPLAVASGASTVAGDAVAPKPEAFGGNSTGRKFSDKFKHPPTTAEGIEERRKADADRKAAARAVAAKLVDPAPLPSAVAGVAAQPIAPDRTLGSEPLFGSTAPETPPVLWQPEMLNTIVEKLLSAAEEGRVGVFLGKCEQAGLMPKLVKEIEADAHFPQAAKALLKDSLPRLACKWLNKFGVSAEFRDELACVTAILLIVKNDRSTAKRLDELISLKRAELARQGQGTAPAAAMAAALPDPPAPINSPKPVLSAAKNPDQK